MDDRTLQALTALAEKLGTTAEYLWGVLLKQAPISGATGLVVVVALSAVTVWWVALVKRKTTEKEDTTGYTRAEWCEEAAFFAWATAVIAVVLSVIFVASSATCIAAAFANPEYWALKQVLSLM